jgi:murein DD-endopeptidase MepM/ murein hydrolase activator NlpD
MRSLALLLIATVAWAAPDKVAVDTLNALLAGKSDAATAQFADRAFAAKVVALVDQVRAAQGPSVKVTPLDKSAFEVEWTRGPKQLALLQVEGGKVVAALFKPRTSDPFDNYQTKTRLRPPFAETWTARNAARVETNHHYVNPNQRFAVDWAITDENGKSHRGDGKRNEDYLCYGKPALAVADATVVSVVDGVPDNVPGQMDGYHVIGNEVVLDLGGGEYAMYAHLIAGSMTVKPGQRVKAGDPLAKVGNSGNSSEPHLHFQLSDSPRLHQAHALPAQYADVMLDGKRSARAWPTEGQRVGPAAAR